MDHICISRVLHASPNSLKFIWPSKIILDNEIMKHLIAQTPPLLRYLTRLKAKQNIIFWNYSALFDF